MECLTYGGLASTISSPVTVGTAPFPLPPAVSDPLSRHQVLPTAKALGLRGDRGRTNLDITGQRG